MNDTVLIVDDSLTVRMDLSNAFEEAGFKTLPCATIESAREALLRTPAGVVVLDVLLPDGDGVDYLQELRSARDTASAVVVLLSTESEVKDRIRGLNTGADEYVGKPYDIGFVVARARELLRRQADVAGQKPSILLIDDSDTFREALKSDLEANGYSVLPARTGEEGLRIAADSRPSAIIVDGMLPGIDGATVIRRLRLDAALRGTPCLLLTASDDLGAELQALDIGADAFVRKEEETAVVLARLAAVLRSAEPAPADRRTSSLLGPKRLLAVDDSPTFLHELSDALRTDGYDVVLARCGEDALDLLSIQSVDCILLDLVMPGLGGQETCRRIKAAPHLRETPLIMLTALEDNAAVLSGLAAGADDFISKSHDLNVLKARVRAQIRRRQFEDENRRIREQLLHRELEAMEARTARAVAETRAALVDELERKNKELESFSYSVSHDLRAPLRSLSGFSQILLEEYRTLLDERGQGYLRRIGNAAGRMGELIDDLLALSHAGRVEMRRSNIDLTAIANSVALELQRATPDRQVRFAAQAGVTADADARLLRIVLENLIGNAWKFTSKTTGALIEFGATPGPGSSEYFVRDNGSGFDMNYAHKLFLPFQRLHTEAEFSGTGIGLATVYRIIDRHGGRVWGEGAVDQGATFHFSLTARHPSNKP